MHITLLHFAQLLGDAPSLCSVAEGCSSLYFVAGGCSLTLFSCWGCSFALLSCWGDAPLLCSVTGGCSSLRFVAGGCSLTSFSHWGMLPHFVQLLGDAPHFAYRFVTPLLCSVAFHSMVPSNWKMCWYPHTNKLFQKCVIFNETINLHSRGSTEQHFYVWEPRCGCLHKVKKVCWYSLIKEGQRSHKYAFLRVNLTIKWKIVLVPPCTILLGG